MKAFPNLQLTVSKMGQVRAINEINTGMDLRDYFAAKALPSVIIAFKEDLNADGEDCSFGYNLETEESKPNSCCYCVAESAYVIADAMMEMRKL